MDLDEKMMRAKSLIQRTAFHATVARSIETPQIDEEKIACLLAILEKKALSDEAASAIVTATMLIQMGLDTHDEVSVAAENETSEILMKRQLVILVGDYYSGLFYKILADQEMDEIIESLALAIMAINATKQELFECAIVDVPELFEKLVIVETKLLTTICQHFHCDEWISSIEQHFLQKMLSKDVAFPFLNKQNQALLAAHRKQKLTEIADSHGIIQLSELIKRG